ncbi:hypothetical protein [Amaricoccus solimangrovi]|uniref:HEPN AbiU2-like domain-containing protein n=1 Tax=Amaricoccus solimangrovi TaxID=2589815 RepID=A0A501WZL5_9RHOB|nr:hypothetical protein [Amaricoccus solimangrovi]TPE53217.1 hypothetical protein FJM51_04145 [Amaricoccus solimangrovi]
MSEETDQPLPESPIEAARKVAEWMPRTLRIAHRTFISHGQFTAANALLLEVQEVEDARSFIRQHDFREVIHGYSHDSMCMAVVGLCSLLAKSDSRRSAGQGVVSLQEIYHRLKFPDEAEAFVDLWEEKQDPAFCAAFGGSRADAYAWINAFLAAWRKLDWNPGGSISRLQHLRHHGIAHLLEKPMAKSVTAEELRNLMESLGQMTEPLGRLNLDGGEWASMEISSDAHRRSLRYWRRAIPAEFLKAPE